MRSFGHSPYGKGFVALAAIMLISGPAAAIAPQGPESEPAAGPSEDAPVELHFDQRDPEVKFYSNRYGVELDRAVDFANWLEDAQVFLTDLPGLTHIYADAQLVHGGSPAAPELPAGEVVVQIKVTDPQDPQLRRLVEALEGLQFGSFRAQISVAQVPRTLAELDERAASEMANDPLGEYEVRYDYEAGTVAVVPASTDQDATWTSSCTNVSGGSLDGGREIRLDNPSSAGCQTIAGCTSAFPMRFAATFGVATAGHCLDSLGAGYFADANGWVQSASSRDTDMYAIHQPSAIHVSTYAYWYDGPAAGSNDDDAGYLRRVDASSTYPGRVWKWSTSEWRHITAYEGIAALTGMIVCQAASPAAANGADTYCGEVIDPVTNAVGNDSGYQRWTEVDFTQGEFNRGMSGGLGGSGGTMFYGGLVYGLMSNGTNCNVPCSPARYYQVRHFLDAMQVVSSDVEFLCYDGAYCDPS